MTEPRPLSDLTPEHLDSLEAKAKAATPGPYTFEGLTADGWAVIGFCRTCELAGCGDWGGGYGTAMVYHREDAAHFAANSPDVTLALVARIRELEEAAALAETGGNDD